MLLVVKKKHLRIWNIGIRRLQPRKMFALVRLEYLFRMHYTGYWDRRLGQPTPVLCRFKCQTGRVKLTQTLGGLHTTQYKWWWWVGWDEVREAR